MDAHNDKSLPQTVIGGRHGSPALTIAFPFSRITSSNDSELREAISDLALLVARLAEHSLSGDTAAMSVVRRSAEELATRVSVS